ncbi:murein transglycosylase A [Thaumasiovibrio subtropicus]|uniref:murein transglycosylase A n=1 Tax=Thaumasiovibrio subtropicus TaxID=1891207 RepID=UPI000B34F0CC|nr:murein transglycosylase A [Thaumasiovibrio subtropicus]
MVRLISVIFLSILSVGCARNSEQGQQYLDGKLLNELNTVAEVNSELALAETTDFVAQTDLVVQRSPSMAANFAPLYQEIKHWLAQGGELSELSGTALQIAQLQGADGFGNVLMTGYFSPVIEMRHQPDEVYQYPVYGKPNCQSDCPTRAEIYWGALDGQGLELGYSASPLDNFMMEVQGSGFVHFGDNDQMQYFAYAGKNNHAYTSIGRVLIERGEVAREAMSLEAIHQWAAKQDEAAVFELMENNASFVFFQPTDVLDVLGSAGIPLVADASVAADRSLLPLGSVLLVEVPQLDARGVWTGAHELRLMVVLDTGGAVKGNHLDLYHGMGNEAGVKAGHYKHFGRVWQLSMP